MEAIARRPTDLSTGVHVVNVVEVEHGKYSCEFPNHSVEIVDRHYLTFRPRPNSELRLSGVLFWDESPKTQTTGEVKMENKKLQEEIKEHAEVAIRLFHAEVEQCDDIDFAKWNDNFRRFRRMLERCGVDADDPVMIDLDELISDHEPETMTVKTIADQITGLLGGRDSMLVPLAELEELARAGGAVGGYLRGVIYARRSLQASGVEAVA